MIRYDCWREDDTCAPSPVLRPCQEFVFGIRKGENVSRYPAWESAYEHKQHNDKSMLHMCHFHITRRWRNNVFFFSLSGSHTEVLLLRWKVKRQCHMALKAASLPTHRPFLMSRLAMSIKHQGQQLHNFFYFIWLFTDKPELALAVVGYTIHCMRSLQQRRDKVIDTPDMNINILNVLL